MRRSDRPPLARALSAALWPALLLLGASGCEQSPDGSATVPAHPTYQRDVAPLLTRRCLACRRDGLLAPFALETFTQVAPLATRLEAAVRARRRPPLPRRRTATARPSTTRASSPTPSARPWPAGSRTAPRRRPRDPAARGSAAAPARPPGRPLPAGALHLGRDVDGRLPLLPHRPQADGADRGVGSARPPDFGGGPQTPRDVTFGARTTDEMWAGTLALIDLTRGRPQFNQSQAPAK